ncbi:MAG TPA: HAMP domain-containing sensor histidine kinase [Pseudonocardiaceae bacterium]
MRADGVVRARRGPGLRLRLTLLATGLVAAVSGLLLWLGWVLAGAVVSAVPRLPAGTTVRVRGVDVDAAQLGGVLRDAARADVLRSGSIAFLLVLVATAAVAWVVTGQVLRPLHDVTATARRLSAESLGERIRLSGPRDEVAELADTFDAMLARLQAAFESQRRFVANASHELRTPLTVMRTEVDVTLADPDADVAELRRMGEVVRHATERADRLVEGLLTLAHTESAGVAVRQPADLATAASVAVSIVGREAADRAVRISVEGGPAPVLGDPALLDRVAGNLLENAVRHNVDGGWVTVCTEGGPGGSTLRVSGSGAVVPPERVAELFEPFRRGVPDRTGGGTGLGLSIVRAVVQAHGGTVRATPVDGGGLTVTVTLPPP